MEVFSTNFTLFDWVIVATYLSGSLLIGIVANRFVHTVQGYIVGGRGVGTALNAATYITTGLGLVSLMYISIDSFSNGFSYLTIAFIGVGVGIFVGTTGFVVRKLRSLELLTIPEYFVHRYNRKTRVLAAALNVMAGILNMGLFPKMGAIFITYSTGLAASYEDPTVIVNIITSILIVFVLIYTVMGGMVSVIITDFIQFFVLSAAMALGLYFCLSHPDLGWMGMMETLEQNRGERAFNPVASGGYGWVWILFNLLMITAGMVTWGPEASRALTAKDERTVLKTFLYSTPGKLFGFCIPALWGIAAYCFVVKNPELQSLFFPNGADGAAVDAGRAMPLALGKIVPAGFLGLLVAGLMAAFMSTHDSYLLGWSSVIARDIVMPLSNDRLSGKQQIFVTRVSIVCIGIFLLIWGVWYDLPDSVWNYMAVTGTIYISGAGVAIIGGVYWRRASSTGAVAGLLGGLSAVPGVFIEPINDRLGWSLTAPIVGIMAFVISAGLFVVFSLLFPDRPGHPKSETNL